MLQSNLSPIAECEHNSPVLTSRHTNLPPFDTTRRRNNAVSTLYKAALKKRNSAEIISFETLCENNSSLPDPIKKPTTSLNVVLCREPHIHKAKNPISHYENDMNHTLASRSSSATQLSTIHRPKLPVRSRSTDFNSNIMEATRGNSSHSSIDDSPKRKKNTGLDFHQEASKSSMQNSNDTNRAGEDLHEHLSDELLSALNDDIFDVESTFDNKWIDNTSNGSGISCFNTTFLHEASETYCAVHNCPKNTCLSCITRKNVGLGTSSSQETEQTAVDSDTKNSRFQFKLDTLRLKVQSTRRGSRPLDSEVASSETKPLRYWSNNATLRTKMVSETVNRELKCVIRGSSYAHNHGGKMLLSILGRVPYEERLRRASRMTSPLKETLTVQPVIGSIQSSPSEVSLSDYLQKNLSETSDASFKEQLSSTIRDRELYDHILRGRENSRELWIEAEKSEFH